MAIDNRALSSPTMYERKCKSWLTAEKAVGLVAFVYE